MIVSCTGSKQTVFLKLFSAEIQCIRPDGPGGTINNILMHQSDMSELKNLATGTKGATDTFINHDGNETCYKDVFDGILSNVRYYATRGGSGMDEDELTDIFQTAALKAVKSHGSYNRSKSSPGTWGSRIAGNCERDAFASWQKKNSLECPMEREDNDGDDYIPSAIQSYRSEETMADRRLESDEAMQRIGDAMDSLVESYRDVLSMKADGLKPQKMAEILGCTPSAASTELFRARKALARLLGREFLAQYGIAV